MAKAATVDEYLAGLEAGPRTAAEQVRAAIRKALPDAEERVSYGMPAYRLGGRNILYFGVWKKHIGLYPIQEGDAAFEAEVGPLRATKDTVQLKLDKPVPSELVVRIASNQRDRLVSAPVR